MTTIQADIEALEHALALSSNDENGFLWRSAFFDLSTHASVLHAAGGFPKRRAISDALHDLWQLSAIASRVAWSRRMERAGQLDPGMGRSYFELDIDLFHIRLRSMMDHVAKLISLCTEKPGQTPTTFAKLRTYATKRPDRLPPGVAAELLAADWFDEIRAMRDALVHEGGRSMAFYSDDVHDLLYQIHRSSSDSMISRPSLVVGNLAKFDYFVAWSVSHAMRFMDRVGALLVGADTLDELGRHRTYSMGYAEWREWMADFLDSLRATASEDESTLNPSSARVENGTQA